MRIRARATFVVAESFIYIYIYIYMNKQKNVRACSPFQLYKHEISEISFILIEKITSQGDAAHIDRLLLTREAHWTAQLCTLNPHGLNKRRDFRSKNRVRYNT